MSLRLDRALRLVGAGLLTLSAATAGIAATAPSAAAAEPGGTAVTVAGTGPFADLRVTVSRTEGLRNEVVQVSWTGARPTRGNFSVDYLQIMQCWGGSAGGPDREQCQFGGLTGDSRGGAQVASRQVTYDIVDPQEPLAPTTDRPLRFVPFRSVTGKTTEAGLSEFFDATTTNEVPFAATRGDGGGAVPFEVQTSVEAPGLGCGAPVAAAPTAVGTAGADTATVDLVTATPTATVGSPRPCWLVVVPRGDVEVDGSARTATATGQLLSSPLSATNWAQRLAIPLSFAPVGSPCPIGRAERAVVGHESVLEAISSWQPALCADGGPVYSFSQVPDAVGRRQVTGNDGGLAVTTRPLSAQEGATDPSPVYAPLALGGLTIGFNIESQSAFSAPPEVKVRDGQRLTELNLTPRLVAKLLTQSYRSGAAAPDRPGIEENPQDLTRDPDFLRVNPGFTSLRFVGIPSILVPAGLSDAGGLLLSWLLADAEAAAFLAGTPDPDGMVVNPAYTGLSQQDGFPKSDTVCQSFLTSQPPLCTLDAFPYAGDGHEAARAAARGDTLARSIYDPSQVPASYRKTVPQPTGQRAVLALTDVATAHRFGLGTARLRNASGAFVAPTPQALLAGMAAMAEEPASGVLLPNPTTTAAGAYPLAQLSYGVTLPDALTAQAREQYAALLRYAAGPGQEPGTDLGQLPPGYAPLPSALRQQTTAAATRVAAASPAASSAPAQPAEAPGRLQPDPPAAEHLAAPPPAAGFAAGPVPDIEQGAALPLPPVTAPAAPAQVLLTGRTPVEQAGAVRYAVPAVLLAGGAAALTGSGLRQAAAGRARRSRSRGGASTA